MRFNVIAYANAERKLPRKEVVIYAADLDTAYYKAWREFDEYKEILVTPIED